jgi:hypothetical protein
LALAQNHQLANFDRWAVEAIVDLSISYRMAVNMQ